MDRWTNLRLWPALQFSLAIPGRYSVERTLDFETGEILIEEEFEIRFRTIKLPVADIGMGFLRLRKF